MNLSQQASLSSRRWANILALCSGVTFATLAGSAGALEVVSCGRTIGPLTQGFPFSGLVGSLGGTGLGRFGAATIDWGDGTSSTVTVHLSCTTHPNGATFCDGGIFGTHTYSQAEQRVTIALQSGGASCTVPPFAVLAAPGSDVLGDPTLQLATATAKVPVSGVIATFSDSNPQPLVSDFVALINWGDGTQSGGVISSSGSTLSVSPQPGGHAYHRGTYKASVTLAEVADATVTSTATGTVHVTRNVTPMGRDEAALKISMSPAAQHARYDLIDTGTLGGPTSFLAAEGERHLNNGGTLVSQADTSFPDPYCPNCFPIGDNGGDGFLSHTVEWQNGVLTDLGALPGVNDSTPTWISDSGLITGFGTNGLIDPLTGLPVLRGILYKGGRAIDVGSFGGYESIANAVNSRGQVVGCAATAVPDPYAQCSGQGSQQSRAFLWQNGVMQDLGTLGGPDAVAVLVNERGQVAGWSMTDSAPNAITGMPTTHPFLWDNGTMRDLGTIGGTAIEQVNALNSRGQVVGSMNVAGDQSFHPFLWDGQTLQDLGTFGGPWGRAISINDAGAVVGWATTQSATHAFLWQRGTMSDLGGRGCEDVAYSINSRMQIVGYSADADCAGNTSAFLWENGSAVDLNTLVASNPSGAQLTIALIINERGEIAAQGLLPNGDLHAFLLVPSGTK